MATLYMYALMHCAASSLAKHVAIAVYLYKPQETQHKIHCALNAICYVRVLLYLWGSVVSLYAAIRYCSCSQRFPCSYVSIQESAAA
jgi:hypothetical protein